MNTLTKIEVPFSMKAKAREYGAIFNKDDRCWYLPDNATDEQISILTTFTLINDENCNTYDNENEENVVSMLQQNSNYNPTFQSSAPESFWNEVIQTQDTLRIALAIKDNGMPGNESQRTELLNILALRRPNSYPITYDGMIECSREFELCYPKDRVLTLTQENITGSRPYLDEIRDANITEEEKALLRFFLPILY